MDQADEQARETTELRDRLAKLSEASLRINETLDLDWVLQEVIDSARSLAGASYGGISTIYEARRGKDLVTSGMTTEEHQRLAETPGGADFFQYLLGLAGPLRIPDMGSHFRLLGLPEFQPPMPATSFLATLLRNQGMAWGVIYLANGEGGREFTAEDEETLVMFASQAALVIANARRYREEQKARTDLETLINTSPVGVVVFDAKTGAAVSFNREAVRIMQVLRTPDSPPEQLLEVLTVQRGDGRRVSLAEVPVAQTMMAGETVRAEEILLSVPDGRSVSMLMNATPIRSDDGEVETYVVTFQDMTALEELERLRAEFLGMVSHELRTPPGHGQGLGVRAIGRVLRDAPRRGAPVPSDYLRTDRPDARADRRPSGRGSHSDGHPVRLPGADGRRGADGRGRERLPYRRAWAQPSHRRPAGSVLGHGGQIAHRPGA